MIQPGLMTGVSGIGMVLLNERHSLATLQTILSGGLLPVSSCIQEDTGNVRYFVKKRLTFTGSHLWATSSWCGRCRCRSSRAPLSVSP
jgi:hypothetical protein